MTEITLDTFRRHMGKTVNLCAASHEALRVRRRGGEDFVVLSASDWRAIEETLYLNRVPGLVESIHAAAAEPLEKGTPLEKLNW